MKTWVKDMNRHFSKDENQMANRQRKTFSRFTSYQRNANKNHNKIPPNSCKNGLHTEITN